MSISVNPPPQLRIPKIILQSKEWLEYEKQRDIILFQLYSRTGGNDDNVSNPKGRFEIVNVTSNKVTSGSQILICRNTLPIVIQLDPNAIEETEVHVKRRGSEVLVTGSIDGETDRTINILNWNDHYVFDGVDWSVL
jgi:hypothetical protein